MTRECAVRSERWAERDGGYSVPDLPLGMFDGKTPETALKHVQEAIACSIEAAKGETMAIAQPSPPLPCAG